MKSPSTQRYLILDYETRSEADLKKVGAVEYSKHASTRVLCAAWRIGTREELRDQLTRGVPAMIWSPVFNNNSSVDDLRKAVLDSKNKLVAHNALFEQAITRFSFLPKSLICHDRWVCTAAMAAACALPRNLEGACLALGLPVKKDMDGRRLMLKLCKPRKPSKHNPSKWHQSARDLRRVMLYCQRDVDAETYLFLSLPELNETERKVWLLDQEINFRGFRVDRKMVHSVLGMIDVEVENLTKETKEITKGAVTSTNQRARVLEWIGNNGAQLPDLRSKTVSDALSGEISQKGVRRLLEIRQAVSKTSTAKYQAFEERSRSDGRVRDILVYHAASTGRWSGAGVQPQNFPRGTISDTVQAAGILSGGDLELVRLLYGNPMDVFSSCLRSVIIPSGDKKFYCADYAAIETRVLFWIADHEYGLRAFRDDRPMYEEMAAAIYNIDHIENVTKDQRQVGKGVILGCGFGMGAKKFLQTCLNYGIAVDDEIAVKAVKAYRETHAPIPRLWSNIERAAVAAIKNPGKKFKINHTTWWVYKNFLWCELPSKRRLAYYKPSVRYELTPWDTKRPVPYHYGVNPLSRNWESAATYGGKLTENVVQAVARDLMAEAMLRLNGAGYEIVLSVHDEVLAEAPCDFGGVDHFNDIMAESPQWATGCPIKVEGWSGERYRK